MMETECRCCTNDRFYSNEVHIAQKSSESWIIENNSPETCQMCSKNGSMALKKRAKQRIIKNQCCLRRHRPNGPIKEAFTDEDIKRTQPHSNVGSISSNRIADIIKNASIEGSEMQSDSSENSINSSIKVNQTRRKRQVIESDSDDLSPQLSGQSSCNNHNSSTSNQPSELCKSTDASNQLSFNITPKGILLHEPPRQVSQTDGNATDISLANCNANFTLTEHTLSPIIGQRRAQKLLKYHTGCTSFNSRYHVYYRPSTRVLAKLTGREKTCDLTSSSCSDSDSDVFEMFGRYGVIHSVLEKSNDSFNLDL